jgi:hypothetical protein
MLLAFKKRRLYPHRKQVQVPKVEADEFLQLLVPVLAYKDLCQASLLALLQPCHRELQRLNLPLLGIYCVLHHRQNTIEQSTESSVLMAGTGDNLQALVRTASAGQQRKLKPEC